MLLKNKLSFQDASESQIEYVKKIRGRILTELYYIDISEFDHINKKHLTKEEIMNYISYKDDIYFFTQYKGVDTLEIISNVIFKMNKS